MIRRIIQRLNKLFLALIVPFVACAEWLMHALNIPHIEGWWVVMLEGGVAITGAGAVSALYQKMIKLKKAAQLSKQ
jgi:hypothetical protein